MERGQTSLNVTKAVISDDGGCAALLAALAVAEAPAPRLLPNLGEFYRAKVAALQEALAGEGAAAVREQIRALIDEIRLVPCPADAKAPLRIEVRGALAGMLALGSGTDASAGEQLAKQFKLVAGARNQRFLRLAERVIPKLAA